jgi:hypothetical protein
MYWHHVYIVNGGQDEGFNGVWGAVGLLNGVSQQQKNECGGSYYLCMDQYGYLLGMELFKLGFRMMVRIQLHGIPQWPNL